MRVTKALNRLLRLPGASVIDVTVGQTRPFLDRDGVPEPFELGDEAAGEPCRVGATLEVVTAEFAILDVVAQHVPVGATLQAMVRRMTRQSDVYDAGRRGDWELLVRQLETTPIEDRRRREVICTELMELRPQDAVPVLRRVAADGREGTYVRIAALKALRDIGDRSARPEVLELLYRGPPRAGRVAAETIGRMGGEDAEPALLAALDTEDKGARASAANVLGLLKSEQAVGALAQKVASGDHMFVRQQAGRALHRIGTPDARERLQAALDGVGRVTRWRIRRWIKTAD